MLRKSGRRYQYTGTVHIHTTESDGTRSLEEVVTIGQEVGLEFMMFADHMTLSNRDRGKEGFYGKTLVTVGYEHNDADDHHHYLLFGSPGVYPADMAAADYVAAGANDGALGILAHPDEIRDALPEHPPYPWKDWSVTGYDGIELWNQMSEWTEKLTRFNRPIMAFSPRKSLVAPTRRILRKWDEISQRRKCVGIASPDAHAFPIRVWPFTVEIFPYKVHFRSLRCYVLLSEPMSDEFETARDQLYDAFRDCRLYFANVRWGDAESFEFVAESGSRRDVTGGQLPLEDGTRLAAELPSRATVRLIHNGEQVLQADTAALEYRVKAPGIYRLEAWKGKHGWIFSNHIRIGIDNGCR